MSPCGRYDVKTRLVPGNAVTVAIGDTLLQDRNWPATDVLRTLAVNVIRYREDNR